MMMGKSYVRFTSEFPYMQCKNSCFDSVWYWTIRTMYVQLCTYIVCTNPYVQKSFIPNVIRTKSVCTGFYVQCTGLYVQCMYIVRTFAHWDITLFLEKGKNAIVKLEKKRKEIQGIFFIFGMGNKMGYLYSK